ncbi:hypothetical protein FF011L_42920 [Roseimaritima multifibrata]|uniref:Ice-binding protein C-terminal domain-containing protein n=1 Tax=Roseimaritima multifibrata TaxID=1930274 RepID=A0A517MKS3_9BACT|nr:PEP-CTERM sorting domain-containing protein [Roseimaritima multifibrata]QDS95495.1 hypothetical protein FF011L_42920 [Roseimaritima multifibrata]
MSVKVRNFVLMCAVLAAVTCWSQAARAGMIYVGSWDVYASPLAESWNLSPPNGPLAYTGQEAAALIFGGSPGDYSISTIDINPLNINNMAWYDTIGIGESIQAEDWNVKYLGFYYGPTSGYAGGFGVAASSALVKDNLVGHGRVNYAFRSDTNAVPEPSSLGVLGVLGVGLMISVYRRRSATACASC